MKMDPILFIANKVHRCSKNGHLSHPTCHKSFGVVSFSAYRTALFCLLGYHLSNGVEDGARGIAPTLECRIVQGVRICGELETSEEIDK